MSVPASDEAIAALLNEAYGPLRALPRVVPQPVEVRTLTPEDIAARRADGWFGAGCLTTRRQEHLAGLLDFVVSGDAVRLGAFAVHPADQRQGLGSSMLKRALEAMQAAGATSVRTEAFVDSRNVAACNCLEKAGYAMRNPEQQSIVMQIDMTRYQPLPVELPAGYRLESLRLEWVEQWTAVKNRVFESGSGPEWFNSTFGSRWDFELTGWHALFCGEEMIGIAAADLHRDPARPERYSGCQIEYVGLYAEHRGKRLGEMLMAACLNYTKSKHVQPCQLITQPFRQPAVKLYERLGFHKVRENRIYERLI